MGSVRTGNQCAGTGQAIRLIRTATALLLATAAISNAMAASSDPSLCKTGETSLFSCAIGHKVVSVCAADTKATYYFGTPSKVELSSQALSIADHMFSGGGETQISVKNGAYSYIVYDKTVRTSFSADGPNDPDSVSGLVVQKNGKTISAKECASDATISADANHIIEKGSFLDH